MTKNEIDQLSRDVIGAAIEVHKALGPGLLESVYHKCLKHELGLRGISVQSELIVPLTYKELKLEAWLKCDLVVNNRLIVEVKSVEEFHPVHEAQLLTYMHLLNIPKGVLINFNCTNIFKYGQATYVNKIYRELPEV